MKNAYFKLAAVLLAGLLALPLVAQTKRSTSPLEAGAQVGGVIGQQKQAKDKAQQEAERKKQEAARKKREASQKEEQTFLNQKLATPDRNGRYDLTAQVDPKNRSLQMNNVNYVMTNSGTARHNGTANYNTYKNPNTGEEVCVRRLDGQMARDNWNNVSGFNKGLAILAGKKKCVC